MNHSPIKIRICLGEERDETAEMVDLLNAAIDNEIKKYFSQISHREFIQRKLSLLAGILVEIISTEFHASDRKSVFISFAEGVGLMMANRQDMEEEISKK